MFGGRLPKEDIGGGAGGPGWGVDDWGGIAL